MMTTPEALKRRQILELRWLLAEGAAIFALGIALAISTAHGRAQDDAQRRCQSAFMATTSQTAATRGRLLERESDATRKVISAALTAHTQHDLIVARRHYFASLKRIDKLRDENPIAQFDKGQCR